jgi:hypothetical protein
MEALKREQAELDSAIDEIMSIIESRQRKEESVDIDLTDEIEVLQMRSSVVDGLISELSKIDREHINPVDLDARMMKCSKTTDFAYNAQAVVDETSGLIVAEDVVGDESDNAMLTPMIEKVEENLGGKACETAADGGYYSPEQLIKAEEAGMGVLVNISERIEPKGEGHEFHKSEFSYDAEKDVVICPQGKELEFERVKKNKSKKHDLRLYRCHQGKDCPVARRCTSEKRGRSIEIEPHYEVLCRQVNKQKDPYKRGLLAKRKRIVEPVFGIIKHCMGFGRFTVRGLEKVKTQWSLICTTFNLRKLFRLWVAGKLVFA